MGHAGKLKIQEKERHEAVQRFLQLDYDKSVEFQDIVDLASQLCQKPVALITLLDKDIQWIKVRAGLDIKTMPKESSFCQYSIQQDDLLIIPDALKDHRFDNNPLVQSNPNVRFYAGAPLILKNGIKIGTLCLFDNKPSTLSVLHQKTLTILSRQATYLMELEMSQQLLLQHIEIIETSNESLRKIAQMQSHDIRQPLTSIMGLINIIKEEKYINNDEILLMLEEAANALDNKIHAIVKETKK